MSRACCRKEVKRRQYFNNPFRIKSFFWGNEDSNESVDSRF